MSYEHAYCEHFKGKAGILYSTPRGETQVGEGLQRSHAYGYFGENTSTSELWSVYLHYIPTIGPMVLARLC